MLYHDPYLCHSCDWSTQMLHMFVAFVFLVCLPTLSSKQAPKQQTVTASRWRLRKRISYWFYVFSCNGRQPRYNNGIAKCNDRFGNVASYVTPHNRWFLLNAGLPSQLSGRLLDAPRDRGKLITSQQWPPNRVTPATSHDHKPDQSCPPCGSTSGSVSCQCL